MDGYGFPQGRNDHVGNERPSTSGTKDSDASRIATIRRGRTYRFCRSEDERVKETGGVLDVPGLEEEEYIEGSGIGVDKRERHIPLVRR
jgi:hypothetical protein